MSSSPRRDLEGASFPTPPDDVVDPAGGEGEEDRMGEGEGHRVVCAGGVDRSPRRGRSHRRRPRRRAHATKRWTISATTTTRRRISISCGRVPLPPLLFALPVVMRYTAHCAPPRGNLFDFVTRLMTSCDDRGRGERAGGSKQDDGRGGLTRWGEHKKSVKGGGAGTVRVGRDLPAVTRNHRSAHCRAGMGEFRREDNSPTAATRMMTGSAD